MRVPRGSLRTASGGQHGGEHEQERRLAGHVGADERGHLARQGPQVDVVDREPDVRGHDRGT
jgi:hypothetical protein